MRYETIQNKANRDPYEHYAGLCPQCGEGVQTWQNIGSGEISYCRDCRIWSGCGATPEYAMQCYPERADFALELMTYREAEPVMPEAWAWDSEHVLHSIMHRRGKVVRR